MAKAMTLVSLDVHARQTHAAVLHLDSGELAGDFALHLQSTCTGVEQWLDEQQSKPTNHVSVEQ